MNQRGISLPCSFRFSSSGLGRKVLHMNKLSGDANTTQNPVHASHSVKQVNRNLSHHPIESLTVILIKIIFYIEKKKASGRQAGLQWKKFS